MAPKGKRKAGAGAGASPKKRVPAKDWRAPLFYWRGVFADDFTWKGTWVASEDGLPDAEAFAASPNTFALRLNEPLGMIMLMDDGDMDGAFVGGSYKLDQGDGLADYSDVSHRIHVIELVEPSGEDGAACALVSARGTTEFGEFASLGVLSQTADGANELTLARRYIGDKDARCKLGAKEVAALVCPDVKKKELKEARFEAAPWEALPWKK